VIGGPDGMMRAMRLSLLLLLCACSAPSADLVLRGGQILTMDPRQPRATALAIGHGVILAVGSDEDVAPLIAGRTQVVELAGRTACPGFFDAHLHLCALAEESWRVDLVGTGSEAEVVDRVAQRAAGAPPGEWITGRGWDQNDWAVKDFPTQAALSAAVPDRPVALWRIDGHALLANAQALERADIGPATIDPEGGRIVRDAAGVPTGLLVDNAMRLVTDTLPAPEPEALKAALGGTIQALHRQGITSVADMGVPLRTAELYGEMAREGRFPLRVEVLLDASEPVVWNDTPGLPTDDLTGDGLIAVRGVKAYADGALGSRGAALLEPYADDPSQSGLMLTTARREQSLATRCLKAGWQLATHAIGDAAVHLVLDAYESALRAVPPLQRAVPEPRLRIEHAQIVAPADVPRFGKLNVIASMQALHQTSDAPWAEARVGPERIAGAYAWRSLLDTGARLCGGSDAPVERADPLKGFHANVTRRDEQEQPEGGWHPEQRMTREEALASITSWAAHACFVEGRRGMLRAGKDADVVVLSADPLAVPEAELLQLRVEATIFAGHLVYERTPSWP
jgi:predicted amidohydrolase YtcJ